MYMNFFFFYNASFNAGSSNDRNANLTAQRSVVLYAGTLSGTLAFIFKGELKMKVVIDMWKVNEFVLTMTHNDPKGLYVSVYPGEHIAHPPRLSYLMPTACLSTPEAYLAGLSRPLALTNTQQGNTHTQQGQILDLYNHVGLHL